MFLLAQNSYFSGNSSIKKTLLIWEDKYFLKLFEINIGTLWKLERDSAVSPTDRHNSAWRNSTGIASPAVAPGFIPRIPHLLPLSIMSLAQEN